MAASASTFVSVLLPMSHEMPTSAQTTMARSEMAKKALESCGASQGSATSMMNIRTGMPRANTLCRIGWGV